MRRPFTTSPATQNQSSARLSGRTRSVNAPRRKHHELDQHRKRLERVQGQRQEAVEQALGPAAHGHAGPPRASREPGAGSLCAERGRDRAPGRRLAGQAVLQAGPRSQELIIGGGTRERVSKSALPSIDQQQRNAMNREQWMWMRASVALVAAAAAALRFSTAGEETP